MTDFTFKEIRVFVSSTFHDMEVERNYLVTNTFPLIRKRCRESQFEFTDIDLRWGISEEESGKVIEHCLMEIDRCRPFFIGILGNRYGWIPNEYDVDKLKDVVENYDWLKEKVLQGLSITEIEFEYYILKQPAIANTSLFVFKNNMTKAEQGDLPGTEAYERLNMLKNKIRSIEGIEVKEYQTKEELGEFIENKLWGIIRKEHRISSLSRLFIDPWDFSAFVKSRCLLYVGGEAHFARLEDHFNNNGAPLIIHGESGIGKSALVANWVAQTG